MITPATSQATYPNMKDSQALNNFLQLVIGYFALSILILAFTGSNLLWSRLTEAKPNIVAKGDDGRHGLILDRTIFYPQGGGQPADTGFIHIDALDIKFAVHDVRSKGGIVLHYGVFEGLGGREFQSTLEKGKQVSLFVNFLPRRKLNSRLHSAGHFLDICLPRIGLGRLEPGKAYHFSDGRWVEYKGVIPQNEIQNKQKELEQEANALISMGGKVSADILPYDEAAKLCGGCLPDYVPKVLDICITMKQANQQ